MTDRRRDRLRALASKLSHERIDALLLTSLPNIRYLTGFSGTSALASKILPDLAQVITLRYIRQMMMHRVVFERPSGATGPMKNFSLALVNKPGVKVVVSRDGNMP